jgi:hypothetical protein
MTEPPDELLAMAARSAAATPASARSSVPLPALTLLNPGMRRKLKVHARMIQRGFMANHFLLEPSTYGGASAGRR